MVRPYKGKPKIAKMQIILMLLGRFSRSLLLLGDCAELVAEIL
jgi:hypothetical protein